MYTQIFNCLRKSTLVSPKYIDEIDEILIIKFLNKDA